MPPVNQGSRGGLITAVVIFTILFVTATIFAIIYSVESRRVSEELLSLRERYNEIVEETEVEGNLVQDLKASRANSKYPGVTEGMPVINVAVQQRDTLARRIAGSGATAAGVLDAADAALKAAADRIKESGLAVPTDSLTNAVTAMSNAVQNLHQQNEQLKQQLQQQTARADEAVKRADTLAAEKNQEVTGTNEKLSQALSDINAQLAAKDTQITDMQKRFDDDISKSSESLQQAQVQVQDRERQIAELQKEISKYQQRLGQLRLDPTGGVLRQTDGRILRLPGNDIAYINLGQGDQITPGLTFQVYDKVEGIPALQANEEQLVQELPVGKAELEVIRVGPGSSEARIIKVYPGHSLSEGDLIANLIYDKNTKYNFMVYGQFDLDHNGQPTDADAEVIKRLITQWGGRLSDQIGVETDFVVLGVEPEVPQFTPEELQDPFNLKKLEEATERLKAYTAVREDARSLYIPILNQNRFLYFVGYYSQASR